MDREERLKWVNSLKVGNKVCVSYSRKNEINTIIKITPTQIVLSGNARYRKSDCMSIGSSMWNLSSIMELTEELYTEINLRNAQNLLRSRLENLTVMKISLDNINKINKVLDEVLK